MNTSLTAAERRLRSQLASHESWANTENRTERTAPARKALNAKFVAEADGDPKRAESLRKAYYAVWRTNPPKPAAKDHKRGVTPSTAVTRMLPNDRSRPDEGGSEMTIAAVNTILTPQTDIVGAYAPTHPGGAR